jgi:hypothetical protein
VEYQQLLVVPSLCGLGRQTPKPSSESRSVFLLHRNKLHTHAFFGFAPLDDGARTHLSRRYVKQQLYRSAGRRRVR